MSSPLLVALNLEKRFGPRIAVQDVSFEVHPGEAVGLLGPNGAGKTTTLSLLTGLLQPDAGEVLIEGRRLTGDTDALKRELGLVPQDLALYEELSARDNLQFFGTLQGLAREPLQRAAHQALELVGLADRASDIVRTYSGGMKRRLNLAVALLHQPKLLLLDEPTVGVDPQSRNAIFENIEVLRRQGTTILYTTHYMEEVERLCDRVIVIDHGRVIADDSLARLKGRLRHSGRVVYELGPVASEAWLEGLRHMPGVLGAEIADQRLRLHLAELALGLEQTLRFLREAGVEVVGIESTQPSLEDAFLELTGRSLRDA